MLYAGKMPAPPISIQMNHWLLPQFGLHVFPRRHPAFLQAFDALLDGFDILIGQVKGRFAPLGTLLFRRNLHALKYSRP